MQTNRAETGTAPESLALMSHSRMYFSAEGPWSSPLISRASVSPQVRGSGWAPHSEEDNGHAGGSAFT